MYYYYTSAKSLCGDGRMHLQSALGARILSAVRNREASVSRRYSVRYMEVVRFSEGPLLEVRL